MTKVCRVCDRELNLEFFHAHSTSKDGYMKVCITCHQERCSYKPHDPEHRKRMVKNRMLKCEYGITIEQYEEMEKNQMFGCAICGGKQVDDRGLAVDHCHRTGKVRGLLCSNCNRALGGFKDDPNLLDKASAYLKNHNLIL